jgi:hypothetical protein
MEEAVKVRGIAPGFLLLPAREYEWQLDRRVEIRVPRQGSVSSLLGKQPLAEGIKFPGDDDFSIFEDNLLLLWEVVRVMFAGSQYPHLEDNQCLNIVALEVLEQEIVLHGEVIRAV